MSKTSLDNMLDRTAGHWGTEAGTWSIGRGRNWFEVPAVRARINRMVSGCSEVDSYHWLMELMANRGITFPVERVLTLGCGAGDLERGLFGLGFARHYEGMDVAPQAIERARLAAADLAGADILYEVVDVNHISLQVQHYDVVFCPMSAHHFTNLERVFREVHRALKPNGIFFLDEYIGPKRFQWLPHQSALVDILLRNLPARWVRTMDQGLRRSFETPSIEEIVKVDPSEAIRSDEILTVLANQFTVTAVRGYGGTLLHCLLDHIGINFVNGDIEEEAMLNTFFGLEDWALDHEIFQHDFAVIVAEAACRNGSE